MHGISCLPRDDWQSFEYRFNFTSRAFTIFRVDQQNANLKKQSREKRNPVRYSTLLIVSFRHCFGYPLVFSYFLALLWVSDACVVFTFTARKQSLGQGNIFRSVCLSAGGPLYDITSCLAEWSPLPSRVGLCPGGLVSIKGDGSLPRGSLLEQPPESAKWAIRILRKCFLVNNFQCQRFQII